ncbi:DUF4124 domain-containing protein [Spongiibacter sp. KMU-158]|uniref:DUF4124 domain-containing protein n=1 Tax=Spongiibacter pelagi TaxID=2760804 RepID=A0A927C1S1_9GAMM|nr:DUF4124 domain-containing protein [Spongiibacter pelagi]MBD2859694.1 DUF4124 domain-containing protein [Spongiibacter pelagi]
MTQFRPLLIACASLLITGTALADSDGYYRWQDESGGLHYSQKPPVGRNYEFIKDNFSKARSTRTQVEVEADSAPTANNNLIPAPTNESGMQAMPPKDPERCAQAKRNLQTLNSEGVRIRTTDENGQSRFLNAEEIEEQRERAKAAQGVFCE